MTFLKRKKAKNRRVPRDVNLDVRLSTDQVRSRRLRITGRVLSVVGRGRTFEDAIDRAYAGVSKISFEGMHYRRDIGRKAL